MGTRGTRHGLRAVVTLLCALLPALVVLAGCGDTSGGGSASPEPSATPLTLKVMEFNIEYGGDTVDFDKVLEAIEKAQPDIIGLEEAETSTGTYREEVGVRVLEQRHAGRLPLPAAGAAGGRGAVSLRAGRARPLRRRLERPPAVRRARAAPDPRRQARREGRRDGGGGAAPVHPGPARGPAAAGGAGHPRVPARRLQRALAPRLHAGGGRHARLRQVRGRVAGEHGGGGGGVRRLVAGRVPGPAAEPRAHVVGGAAQGGRLQPGSRTRPRTGSTSSTPWARRRRRPPSSPASRAAPR